MMRPRNVMMLIVCLSLLVSSQSVFAQDRFAQNSDATEERESSNSPTHNDERDDQDKDKDVREDDDAKAKREAKRRRDQADKAALNKKLREVGAMPTEDGEFSDILTEGADNENLGDMTGTSQDMVGGMGDRIGISPDTSGTKSEAGDSEASPPTIRPGRPTVMGAIDKDDIRKVVKAHQAPLRHCYAKRLRDKPELAGIMRVKFTIGTQGKVVAATVKSSEPDDSELESCLTGVIRAWTFPKPRGGGIVVVTYPFNFSTSEK